MTSSGISRVCRPNLCAIKTLTPASRGEDGAEGAKGKQAGKGRGDENGSVSEILKPEPVGVKEDDQPKARVSQKQSDHGKNKLERTF